MLVTVFGNTPSKPAWWRILRLCMFLASGGLCAQPTAAHEYEVKAAFLFNFAKFVEWPAGAFQTPDSPFVLGIIGEDPFGHTVDNVMDGKTLNGRKMMIKRFKDVQDASRCHMLFVSSSLKSDIFSVVRATREWNTLIVGEVEQFANDGGMINFVIDNGRVRFEINQDSAERAGLKISARLLSLARIVGGGS